MELQLLARLCFFPSFSSPLRTLLTTWDGHTAKSHSDPLIFSRRRGAVPWHAVS